MVSGMTRLSRFAAVVVLVGGATAVLSSCSGDPGPIVTETPSPTRTVEATLSPSPTPTLTPEEELLAQIPEDARGEDFASASNFAKFFVREYTRLFLEDASTRLYAELSSADCEYCASALANARETAEAGAHSVGGEFSLPDVVGRGGLREDGYTYVAQRFELSDATTYGPDGTELSVGRGGSGDVGLKLKFEKESWRVYAVEFKFDG